MNKVKIKKNDYERVVLTDVHPYELPFILTNEGFYNKIRNSNTGIINSLFEKEIIFRPFEFKITKDANSFRNLSLIHPYSQKTMSDFYREHKDLILYFTSLSRISLRHPNNVSMYYFLVDSKEELKTSFIDESVDIDESFNEEISIDDNKSTAYASSFFSYKKYSFLYKFYDSYEMHRLERKFSLLCKQDITKCFESITLDSIQCMIRDEDTTRKCLIGKNSFEKKFTEIMSSLNYGRTNGVIIGPEFSRIFAEIILQQVDCKIVNNLNSLNMKIEKDYSIRRYVDDYFIFSNSSEKISKIENVIKKELYEIKLFFNDSKRELYQRPFVTGVTKAKIKLRELFEPIIRNLEVNKNNEINLDRYYSEFNFKKISNDLISKIKILVSDNNIGYESITGYYFSVVRTIFRKISESLSNVDSCSNSEQLSRFIYVIIDLSFFVYSMDKRVRATFLISQSLIELSKFISKLSYYSEYLVTSKIMTESKRIASESYDKPTGVEQLNLAIALSEVQSTNMITNSDMKKLIGFSDFRDLNYFQIVVSFYVSKNYSQYQSLKNDALLVAIKLVENYEADLIDSQKTHLLFDLMTCPFIIEKVKKEILISAFPSKNIDEIEQYFNLLSKDSWFVEWDGISIERLLMKKELRLAY